MRKLLTRETPITLSKFHIYSEKHKRASEIPELVEKFPYGCGWFTLLFPENQKLISLVKKIRKLASAYNIDRSLEYVHRKLLRQLERKRSG